MDRFETKTLDNATAYMVYHVARLLRHNLRGFLQENALVSISQEQWFILMRLHEKDGRMQTELTNKELNDRPNVTRMLDRLVKLDLVERRQHPEDRRSFLIYLTPLGKRLIKEIFPAVIEIRQKIFAGFSPQDLDIFEDYLRKIEKNLLNI